MYAKNSSAYREYVKVAVVFVVIDDNIKVYTNAEMEYRAADSTTISIATRG